ncbi:MAG: ABC transporter permease [Lachnospiraceae bacterium]|nr:ABC transporter permease [Lachnospiraceae bacterium]
MFWQLYRYRLKRLLNDRAELFWVAVFPLILGTFFHMAFSNISSATEDLKRIPVAVVEQGENFKYTDASGHASGLKSFLETLSGEDGILELSPEKDYDAAVQLLKEGKLTGILVLSDSVHLEFAENGINQTILKNLVDRYLQGEQAVQAAAEKGPEAAQKAMESLFSDKESNMERPISDGVMDPFSQYYFALMAMTCLFGATFGLMNTSEIQADQERVAVRRLVSPTRKGIAVLTDFMAALTVEFAVFLLLLAWLRFVLRVDLGERYGGILLAGAVSCLAGVAFGYFLGVVVRGGKNTRMTVMTAAVLVMSFLSGLMVGGMKQIIHKTVPIVNSINPAALISDCFYHLAVTSNEKAYIICVVTLLAEAVVFGLISAAVLKRQRYRSL